MLVNCVNVDLYENFVVDRFAIESMVFPGVHNSRCGTLRAHIYCVVVR